MGVSGGVLTLIVKHLRRFIVVGLIATGVSYVVFIGALRVGLHYIPASAVAWFLSLLVGFVLNRRYTFGIHDHAGRIRDLAVYTCGALGQLALGAATYALLMGHLGLPATPAFVINTAVVAAANFIFTRWVTFARSQAAS